MTAGDQLQLEASELVGALEYVWTAIQDRHPDVPNVVVTLGAGSIGVPRGALKLGHFAADRWTGPGAAAVAELFIGGEGLSRGAGDVLATLLHEASHGLAHVRGVQDTSRQGRYHNARFRGLAEELGLTVTQLPSLGWSGTTLAPATVAEYAAELVGLAAAITAYRYAEGYLPGTGAGGDGQGAGDGQGEDGDDDTGTKKPKNGVVLTCSCARKVRASATVAELGPILCGLCRTEFTAA